MSKAGTWTFLRHGLKRYGTVGSVHPSSTGTARALARTIARRGGTGTRILEVGPGTGPVTAEIVKVMGPVDTLTCVEIVPEFAELLRTRFATEPDFVAVAGRCEVVTGDVCDLPEREAPFDVAIVTVPFSLLGLDATRRIFAALQRLLRETGTFAYIEYAGLRTVRKQLDRLTGRSREHAAYLEDQLAAHCFASELVVANIPPTWIRHLRFASSPSS